MKPDRAHDIAPHFFFIIPCLVLIAPIMHYSGSDESPYVSTSISPKDAMGCQHNSWAELFSLTWRIISRLFVCFLVSESVLIEKATSSAYLLLLLWFRLQVFLENCRWIILTDCFPPHFIQQPVGAEWNGYTYTFLDVYVYPSIYIGYIILLIV